MIALIMASCASEDPNIVNPPPGNANVIVRMFNMVPDQTARRLVLEGGFQTPEIPAGTYSIPIDSPSDSSFLEIYAGGDRLFRSEQRVRFTRQSVYNVYAVAGHDTPTSYDTIVLSNANRSLTTLPVAQVRALNLVADTTASYDIRVGCPNGEALGTQAVRFKEATLYKELPPGLNVFSISRVVGSTSTLVGTFQCTLAEFTPYSILLYKIAGTDEVQIGLFDEADFTLEATRPFIPVQMTDADMRVFNVAPSASTLTLSRTGQVVASNVSTSVQSDYASVPTCETEAADVLEVTFADGGMATDSTSLTVRGAYTVVTTRDTLDAPAMVVVPPKDPVFGRAGLAVLRVVNASSYPGGISVSIGSRTEALDPSGVAPAVTLASNLKFDDISAATAIQPGEIPLSVMTALTPTTLLAARRTHVEADKDYLIVAADDPDGAMRLYLLEEDNQSGLIPEMEEASFSRFLNGSPFSDQVTVSVGTVITNAQVFYRGSATTSIPIGPVPITVNGAPFQVTTTTDTRTLAVFAVHDGQDDLIEITEKPLAQDPTISQRRVINATADVEKVSVSYSEDYESNENVEHVARNVEYGTTSPIHTVRQERRGTMYVYNSDTFEELFTLPIDLGPLGNSYSLVVIGSSENGYSVVVLQEF